MKYLILFLLTVSAVSCKWEDDEPFCNYPQKFAVSMTTTTATINLNLYAGKWYEIARKPDTFEAGCNCATAQYTLNPAGYVDVVNTCTTLNGQTKAADAKAYSTNSPQNTKLEVYFNPNAGGNYWILDIDPNYQWVVVGEPCRKDAWILSRTPELDGAVLSNEISLLLKKGYTVNDLVYRKRTCTN